MRMAQKQAALEQLLEVGKALRGRRLRHAHGLGRPEHLAGVRTADIDFIRRKSMMKELFHAAGVRVARGRVVHNPAEARALIRGGVPS